jgi:hypothetical protein
MDLLVIIVKDKNMDNPIDAETVLDLLIADSLKLAVTRYGLEGTEDKINELYKLMPFAKDEMLRVYNKLYKRIR